jgi:hypothetical protein
LSILSQDGDKTCKHATKAVDFGIENQPLGGSGIGEIPGYAGENLPNLRPGR